MRKKQFVCTVGKIMWVLSSRSHKRILHIKRVMKIHNKTTAIDPALLKERMPLSEKIKKATLCIPEGIYKIGYGSHQPNIKRSQLEQSIVLEASQFFDVAEKDIWYDFFSTSRSIVNNQLQHTWVASPKSHLLPFHQLMKIIELKNYSITIPPVVISNALCALSQQGLCPENRNWLVFIDQNICFINIKNKKINNMLVIPGRRNYIENGIINLYKLSRHIEEIFASRYNQSSSNEFEKTNKNPYYILGEDSWFYGSDKEASFHIDHKLYHHIEKRIYCNEDFSFSQLHQKTQAYLLMIGLSL